MSRRWHHWKPTWRKMRYQTNWQPTGLEHLNTKIEQSKSLIDHLYGSEKTAELEKLLVLQAPRAALAQAQMDAHPRGYHDREKRLYELIDFNDTFVATVLSEPEDRLPGFAERMKHAMAEFCKSQKTTMFTDEQYDAIRRGLAREIAVYLGAKAEGFRVVMTSRTEDAFGIDMTITDSQNRTVNIDCKTPSAFRYRLEELKKEGRITDNQILEADTSDFITVINRDRNRSVPVTIMCIRPEDLGEIADFRFLNTAPLARLLTKILQSDNLYRQQREKVIG